MARFRNINATPPQGFYEYELDGVLVQDRSRFGIGAKVLALRRSKGLPVRGDGLSYVMEYMCPTLPDGFCDQPSTVKVPRVRDVKARTAGFFGARLAPSDVAERRLVKCISCPMHTRRGFCIDCTGLLDWIRRGMPGRGVLPADRASGVCLCDEILVAAGVSVAEAFCSPNVQYPETCWRLAEKGPDNDKD